MVCWESGLLSPPPATAAPPAADKSRLFLFFLCSYAVTTITTNCDVCKASSPNQVWAGSNAWKRSTRQLHSRAEYPPCSGRPIFGKTLLYAFFAELFPQVRNILGLALFVQLSASRETYVLGPTPKGTSVVTAFARASDTEPVFLMFTGALRDPPSQPTPRDASRGKHSPPRRESQRRTVHRGA